MNSPAQSHLDFLRLAFSRQTRALVYDTPQVSGVTPLEPARAQVISELLLRQYGQDHHAELQAHGSDIRHWLARLEELLREDLADYLGPIAEAVLADVAIGLMPHMASNAFATQVPVEPDAHVIGVNLGLVWVCDYLCEALLRAADGDESGGRVAYVLAKKLYLAQQQRQLDEAMAISDRLKDDAISVHAGAVGSLVLRFVALHELGHIVHGHVGQAGMTLSMATGQLQYGRGESLGTAAVHAMEYEADAFAVERLLARTSGPTVMWNNLLFIGAFFRLLARIELERGHPLCLYHPAPQTRLEKIHDQVTRAIGPPPNDAWQWAVQKQNEWSL